MSGIIEDIISLEIRTAIWRRSRRTAIQLLSWLDSKIPSRRVKVAIGGVLGLLGYVLGAILAGALGL